eukprot:10407286-Karenia_brevis.AAC.1
MQYPPLSREADPQPPYGHTRRVLMRTLGSKERVALLPPVGQHLGGTSHSEQFTYAAKHSQNRLPRLTIAPGIAPR